MVRWVNVHTDDRVADIVRHFETAPGWKVLGAIDSVNWGEGYDLKWRGVPVRLHDEERSDKVMSRRQGACVRGDWDRLFQVVVEEMSGKVTLTFAIDHWGEADPQLYPDVADAIRVVLMGAGYKQGSITVEAPR
jgi:hypothetical protein